MTIQRQYNSPNCILLVEGFSEETSQGDSGVISVVTNTECEIIGTQPKLSGGKNFLEHLVKAVNAYIQEFISGVTHPWEAQEDSDLIFLQKAAAKNRHLLIWQENENHEAKKTEIELTTLQLFDLVDVIDQFFADETTLPELRLDLHPVSRRFRQVEETMIQQSTPAMVGVIGLTLAAIAFFFIPIPTEIKDPNQEESQPRQNTTDVIPNNPNSLPIPETPTSEPIAPEQDSSTD
jgi:hypothetical protein